MNKRWLRVITGVTITIMLVIAVGCSCNGETSLDQTQSDGTSNAGDNTPPFLSLTQPADNSTTYIQAITVAGTTEVGATLTVNDVNVNLLEGGAFNTSVNLALGANRITVIAADDAGNETTKVINVTYVQQTQSTTTGSAQP
jgi:hypothetical protein